MTAPSRLYRFLAEFRDYCRAQSASGFPPAQRHTCRAIIDHMDNQTLTCWVSNRRLAEITGQGETTIRRQIAGIERHGIITKTPGRPGRGSANRYHGNLGFSEKTGRDRPFNDPKTGGSGPFPEPVKRSVGASKTGAGEPRTARNKAPAAAAPLTGATPPSAGTYPGGWTIGDPRLELTEPQTQAALLKDFDALSPNDQTAFIRALGWNPTEYERWTGEMSDWFLDALDIVEAAIEAARIAKNGQRSAA